MDLLHFTAKKGVKITNRWHQWMAQFPRKLTKTSSDANISKAQSSKAKGLEEVRLQKSENAPKKRYM